MHQVLGRQTLVCAMEWVGAFCEYLQNGDLGRHPWTRKSVEKSRSQRRCSNTPMEKTNQPTNQPSLDALVEKEELCQYHPSLQGGTAELEEVSSSSQLRTPGKSKAIEKNHGTNTKLIKM